MAPHLTQTETNSSDAEYVFRTTTGSFYPRSWDDEQMTHNLPNAIVLKRLATRAAIGTCLVLALGVLVAAVRGEAKTNRIIASVNELAAVEPAAIEVVADTNAQLAAAIIQNETPVTGRELLHDQTDDAAARAEVTPRPASAAQSLARVAPVINTIEMEVTAYCACKKCCGPKAQGITASGKRVSHNNGQFVAADRKFRFGTKLLIPGYADGKAVEVLDRGGAIKGNKLDVYFASHSEAKKWGRQKLTVTIVE